MVFLHYLTTVFDNINDIVSLVGVEPKGVYRLLLANKAFSEIFGFSTDVIGKKVSEIAQPKNYKVLVARYERVIKSKKPHRYMEWYDVPAGRLALEVQMIPVLNAVGECVQIIAITRDVTLREKQNAEIAKLRTELAAQKLTA